MVLGYSAPSEEEMESQKPEYPILAEDEYIAKVLSIEVKKDVQNKFPTKGDSDPTHDMLVLKGEVISFADGEEVVDQDGDPLEPGERVTFQVWLNPKKRGLIPQPAKTRKAFAAILGQNLSDPISIDNFEELYGRTFIVSLKPSGPYNNAVDFRPHKRVRTRATTARGPVEGSDIMEKAKEIFDEDSPTNKSPAPETKDSDDLDF